MIPDEASQERQRGSGAIGRRRRRRLRPALMALESRALLSTITVNSAADDGSAGTLRWAIDQANASSEADTIAFSSLFDSPQTIALTIGELVLSDTMTTTIAGPGANLLTINGKGKSRVFEVYGSASISGLAITGGSADYGGGLRNEGGALALTDCTISGNHASLDGGGVYTHKGGATTIYGCTVSENAAAHRGGGIFDYQGDSGSRGGGTTLSACTVSGNSAGMNGGGLYANQKGNLTLTNVTVTGNSAALGGGGLYTFQANSTLVNCTITGNSAPNGDGAMFQYKSTASLLNTIVAGNSPGEVGGSYTGTNNLIGGDPLISALGDYGGPSSTIALLPGSPAIGGGATGPDVPSTDQRGQPRSGHVDIGAFQSQGFTLSSLAGSDPQSAVVGQPFGNALAALVTAINSVEPVDGGVVSFAVTSVGGTSAALSATTANIAGGEAGVTATANWIVGSYSVSASAGVFGPAVFNLANTPVPSLAVDTNRDDLNWQDGQTTLREALEYAQSLTTASTITFSPAAFGTSPQTITLSLGQLALANRATTTISGPGANLLAVDGNGSSRVFDIEGGSAAISGLTVTGGSAGDGGGVRNDGGTLVLTGVTVSGNTASGNGGGIANAQGTLTLSGCTVNGNTAATGGGVAVVLGTATLTNDTVIGNTASGPGGGVCVADATAGLVNVTVTANAAANGGGVFGLPIVAMLSLFNTIVAGQASGGDVSGSFTGANNLIGGNPLLAKLGDYGGPTPTLALLPGSPAIGAGTSGGEIPTIDQRGLPRSSRVDIGAFQSQGATMVVNVPTDLVGSALGRLSLRQAVSLCNLSDSASTITFDPAVFGTTLQTITLDANLGALTLTNESTTTILGPGAALLEINAKTASRVFEVTGGMVALQGMTIANGRADNGGGILNLGRTLSLSDCTFSGNYAGGYGGGLYNDGGALALANCTLSGNGAGLGGGGLYLKQGTLSLSNSTVSSNFTGGLGGGVSTRSGATITVANSTIFGNIAHNGGGLSSYYGTTTLTNVTITGNAATQFGGGLMNAGDGVSNAEGNMTLINCTITGNAAYLGGGVYQNASATLVNTIVSGQNSGGDVSGTFAGGNNLIGAAAGLSTLGDFGGPTQTMALLPGSLAIGGGTAAGAPATDQRGLPRGPRIDIGAFQSALILVNVTSDEVVSDFGQLTLREALNLTTVLNSADTIGFDPAVFSTPQTITLTLGPLVLSDKATTTITGPGAEFLTISAGKPGRVFEVQGGSAAISGMTISGGNTNGGGGGLLNNGGALTLSDCAIRGNVATGQSGGGGLYTSSGGTTALANCNVSANTASSSGGGISTGSGGATTLTGCTVSGNTGDFGGGLYVNRGTTTLSYSTVSNNQATGSRNSEGFGGGLFNDYGTLSLSDCSVTGNVASGDLGGGGLYSHGGTTTLSACTVSGNASHYDGGGVHFAYSAVLTMTNCTVTGNSARNSGGGIFGFYATLTLINCTVSGNTAGIDGAGILISGGTTTVANTIVAGNAGNDFSIDVAYSGSHNLIGGDALLAPLGGYGGPTETMALLPGSPAIGGGTSGSAIPNVDQRGEPRAGRVDIGAFQSQGFTFTASAGSTPQTTTVAAPFAKPLAVTVTAVNPIEPVDGGVLGFEAPSSGASATLSAGTATIASGQAAVTATANTTLGSYTVTASAAGGTTAASFALANSPPNVVAQPVAAVAGQAFINVVLATFTDSEPNASPSDFVAAIAWGDGITTSSTTVVTDGQGRFDVLGTHTYVDAGSYTFSVQVTVSGGASATATSTATVTARSSTEPRSLKLTTHRDVVDAFDGLTSLREAIAYANSHPGPDTIAFEPAVFGKTPRTIKLIGGPLLLTDPATTTIVGPGARFLTLSGGRRSRVFDIRGGSLALEGVTISGGRADRGGGVLNHRGTLALDHVILRGNRARVGGALFNDGKALLSDVVIRGNRARVGGALFNDGKALLRDVVIRGNRARVGCGLFNTRAATFSWRRSPGGGRR
jgi:parallel beta-helix repeat protein